MILSDMGCKDVIVVEDGDQAMQSLRNNEAPFDLIISDWNMPGVSGIDLLSAVRSKNFSLPFIMITGRGTIDSVLEAQAEGVTIFVAKPYTPDQLADKIDEALRQ